MNIRNVSKYSFQHQGYGTTILMVLSLIAICSKKLWGKNKVWNYSLRHQHCKTWELLPVWTQVLHRYFDRFQEQNRSYHGFTKQIWFCSWDPMILFGLGVCGTFIGPGFQSKGKLWLETDKVYDVVQFMFS